MAESEIDYTTTTVTTNAWLLSELLRSYIDDPFDLLPNPHPMGPGYWGELTDDGVSIVDEPGNAVAFIAWTDLRDIVSALYNARGRAIFSVRDRYQGRIRKVEATQGMTHEEMDRINETEKWDRPAGRPRTS